MSSENEVQMASKQFYAALNRMANGDPGSLSDIWAHGEQVTAMHPIGGREVGWEAVRASFAGVSEAASNGKIELAEQLIQVVGDVAYELGVERGQFEFGGEDVTFAIRVTNIYRRQNGGWRIIHHHTDPSPEMLAVLERLDK